MVSPSSRNETSRRFSSSAFASTSALNFSSSAAASVRVHSRRSSPSSPPSPPSSVRFYAEQREESPRRRSMTVTKKQRHKNAVSPSERRTCLCSPSTHPGSFRCAYHKQLAEQEKASCSNRKLNLRRSAMKNSLVRIGGVEGELVKRTLTTLIRPSSQQLRRREGFQPKPSRLSIMSKAEEQGS
ncbi:hypothetical protein RJT34_25951 [Clitoria ternatea]|uniref:Serine-rich protein-like protein n=1 Tax=Clitoria ternatea TaxID=43366 RepID=A0AAN9FBB1_CLITE